MFKLNQKQTVYLQARIEKEQALLDANQGETPRA